MMYFLKNYLFYLYSFIATKYENFFFRDNTKINFNSEFHKFGYQTFNLNKNLTLPVDLSQSHIANPYLNKILLSEDQINEIISKIFIENNIANLLYQLTGFKYNIDHITAYETKHIPEKDRHKGWYANHWHKDGPYSKNNIKLVVPLNDIKESSGGMKIMKSKFSEKFSPALGSNKEFKPSFIFESNSLENILIFAPHLCLHKAGNPFLGVIRRQLIFQLNPASSWSSGKYLFKNQKFIEPKFPIIYNFFKGNDSVKKLILDIDQ